MNGLLLSTVTVFLSPVPFWIDASNAQSQVLLELIAKYNEKVTPVRGFVRAGRAPMIDTGRGTVSLLPVDYLYWSAPLEGLAGGGRGEMWITGRASPLATSQLAALGWTVVPKVSGRLGE